MDKEGWILIVLSGTIYTAVAGIFAWAGYMTIVLSVLCVGLLVLIGVVRRSSAGDEAVRPDASARRLEVIGAPTLE